MILTKQRIKEEVASGEITLEPFRPEQLNPNSYNYRLGHRIAVSDNPSAGHAAWHRTEIPARGMLLTPGVVYLSVTEEVIGSRRYAMTLIGRSSLARLGLFLTITSDLGHVGSACRWTLELTVVQPLRVYPSMQIGQVAFWICDGPVHVYEGRYQRDTCVNTSRDESLIKRSDAAGV
jgi:dCTP deaminase